MVDQIEPNVYVVGTSEHQPLGPLLAAMQVEYREFDSIDRFAASSEVSSHGCVIANLRHFGIGGLDTLLQLRRIRPTLPVIIVSNQVSTRLVVRVMREGALTVLETPIADDELYFTIREALHENSLRVNEANRTARLKSQFSTLSVEEKQVLEHVCMGRTNKEIAELLGVSVRTVEARKKRLLLKTNSDSFPQLLLAYQDYKTAMQSSERESGSNNGRILRSSSSRGPIGPHSRASSSQQTFVG